ncbi:anthrone oxygenase family protein [Planctobacterium marinum]|uniref:anthrone oxygenase family protein n=1 Tax=Planctobacterium marinum TaxID=1631968 RepID=UPI001E61A68C|nr:anthrone oxygenase family protein [Planctobacterium marinum]MCC2604710.1 DUF1772 domain-containing protein [Planctobacterium marinum]
MAVDGIPIVEAVLKLAMLTMIGLYFVFSNTVMNVLKRSDNGAVVMVEINKQIINPVFLLFFMGSAIASLYFILFGNTGDIVAGVVFLLGTTFVTVIKNVPLNKTLQSEHGQTNSPNYWQIYLEKWTFWNNIRTVAAIMTGFLLVL